LIFNLYAKFVEQNKKHGAQSHCVQYPLFCKILQQSENDYPRIKEALHKAGDKPTMSKAFQELGLKLVGDVTLIEALLFLFSEKLSSLVGSPTSPADAALRQAKIDLEIVLKEDADLFAKKAGIESDIQKAQDEHKPKDAIQKKQELAQIDKTINDTKVQRDKRLKAAKKKKLLIVKMH